MKAIDSGGIGIRIETTEVAAIAAFCRVLNALENIRSAIEFAEFARDAPKKPRTAGALIELALADVEDAIEVLDCGGLHPRAQQNLRTAQELLTQKKKKSKVKKKVIQPGLDALARAQQPGRDLARLPTTADLGFSQFRILARFPEHDHGHHVVEGVGDYGSG